MSDFFKRIKYFFLSLKEKNLQNKLKKTAKKSYENKTSKKVYSKAADLTINSQTIKLIKEVQNNVFDIVKQTDCNPDLLLNYIKAAKTAVYKIDNADKLLNLIKEEEGLICEKKGLEAFYISIITGQGIKFSTAPLFILRDGVIDKFYMLHHFYRWYSLKSGLSGFEYSAQKNLKRFLSDGNEQLIKTLPMEDIISLKEAIARDNEATDFVIDYMKSIEGSKKVLDKIKNEGGANI